MAEEKITDKAAAVDHVQLPNERSHFKSLVLGNPNYFGTFPKFGGKAIKAFSGNTTYEQLTCLGLNPGSSLLEGVVNVKLSSGYGTDGCGAGTTEHVRFFVQDATGWHDLGLSSVQVYNLPAPLPLSYAVSVDFTEAMKICFTENIVHVRAILSWEWAPTPGDPNFIPVWGNVVDADVQVAPLLLYEVAMAELIAQKVITIDSAVLKDVDTKQPLPASPPNALSYADLKGLYAKTEVPAHRYGFAHATTIYSGPLDKALVQVAPSKAAISAGLVASEDFAAILAAIEKTKGDTTYEQLTCAGYNPQTRELEAVIQVKQSSGYSGGLCSPGSTEYVGFYAFFNGVWNDLGTAQVQVHDLKATAPTPAHPISYAVFKPSNVTSMPCEKLAGVPLRAILSWSTPPTGPNFPVVWGNVVNTHVQPQIEIGDGEQSHLLRIGRVQADSIDDMTGLAMPYVPVAGDCVGNSSPFGGAPSVEGDFMPVNAGSVFNTASGAINPGAKPIIYQAWVTPSGGTRKQLTNQFWIAIYPPAHVPQDHAVNFLQSVGPAPGPVLGGDPAAEYYTYYESDVQLVNPRVLAVFDASGLPENNYTLEIDGFKWNPIGNHYVAIPVKSKMIHVYNGYQHDEQVEPILGGPIVTVTEYRPEIHLTITAPSGDCGDVQVGDTITGNYSVTDEFFGGLSLALEPITVNGILQPENPVVLTVISPVGSNPTTYDGTNTTGTSGTFSLKTGASNDSVDMTPCGYSIVLRAGDRALVSDNCWGHYNEIAVGFCLRKKQT